MVIESQTYMVINAAVLILAAIQILIGVKRGFLIQLMDCVGLLLSLFAAWLFSPVLAEWAAIVPASLNPARDTVLGPWGYGLMNQIGRINKGVAHRPFEPQSEEYQRLVKKMLAEIAMISRSYPMIDFSEEKRKLNEVIVG